MMSMTYKQVEREHHRSKYRRHHVMSGHQEIHAHLALSNNCGRLLGYDIVFS